MDVVVLYKLEMAIIFHLNEVLKKYFKKDMNDMKSKDLKLLILKSLELESDPKEISREINEAGAEYNFREGFSDKVLDRIFSSGSAIVKKVEFVIDLNFVFYRLALTGAAAVVILLISLFIMEGSFNLNSVLGLGNSYDETITCLLTGY